MEPTGWKLNRDRPYSTEYPLEPVDLRVREATGQWTSRQARHRDPWWGSAQVGLDRLRDHLGEVRPERAKCGPFTLVLSPIPRRIPLDDAVAMEGEVMGPTHGPTVDHV